MQANSISDDDPIAMLMTDANHELVVSMMDPSATQDIKHDVQKSRDKNSKTHCPRRGTWHGNTRCSSCNYVHFFIIMLARYHERPGGCQP